MKVSGNLRIFHRTVIIAIIFAAVCYVPAWAASPVATSMDNFSFKIFHVESALYPFVQVYFRTFDHKMKPLANLNEMNMGVMVKGRAYDITKRQYSLQSIYNRGEAIRTVIIIDCSKSMAGPVFQKAMKGILNYIDAKRPQDQIALLALKDTGEGYSVVSPFERDPGTLGRRLAEVKCDAFKTRLYDGIAYALAMCASASQGGTSSNDMQYIVSNSIVIFSDGKDDGSALSRSDLQMRIAGLKVPIPIYSIALSMSEKYFSSFKNLEALSTNSFGIYYHIGKSLDKINSCVEEIHSILQHDYVLTFRAYVPVDGETHALKVGLEYPSRSGKMIYQSASFEALEAPDLGGPMGNAKRAYDRSLPMLPDRNPYLVNPSQPSAKAPVPGVKK